MSKRKRYTKDFKLNVISMVKEQGLKQAEVVRTMGLHVNAINNWIKEYELSKSIIPSNNDFEGSLKQQN
ncbi:transposase [Vulcanibacillus modesticaldus]|uniref:transposase n=1 Tax=Vulcanibacillus modesticaldus TaxID=337097 RepID=UPI0024810711|nr:transposase [Vulcanibacillus modesticaldus]